MAKKIPTSIFSRGPKLLGLASKVAMNEISSRIKSWEDDATKIQSKIKLAQDMVKTLSELKGASMKLGQLLSLDFGDFVPPEVIKVLEELQNKATFLPFSKIEPILKRELGEKFKDFVDIHEKPLAAASIGQVHSARVKNKNVVIKVQYPDVSKSIPNDIKILKLIVNNTLFLQGKEVDFSELFKELEEVLYQEADYAYELKMQLKYREFFKNSPFIIPEPLATYSTSTILTQEYIEGVSLREWLTKKPSLEKRQRLADELMKLFISEVFYHRLVQTDPNPGNFLITPDDKIALLDFGAVKEYSENFIESYRTLIVAAFSEDKEALIAESKRLNFIDSRESAEVFDLYTQMLYKTASPFRERSSFNFGDKEFYLSLRNLSWELTKKCQYSPPPKELIFLHRKLFGVFILIKALDVEIYLNDYRPYIEKKDLALF